MIDIPKKLLIFNAEDWPGRQPSHRLSIDLLVKREHWRRAQDQWSHSTGIWRDTFEEWQRVQLSARQAAP
ncbi:hypothetical protein [Streptosporangium minutum]|uniref:hypothetical protein n=1 Tax=Streptosporangium minutum TaxID=569862 RepID=UPI001056291C|nr:hypothetical protein [Streptosporangium minutum]